MSDSFRLPNDDDYVVRLKYMTNETNGIKVSGCQIVSKSGVAEAQISRF
jgi:hypothetical protein